MWGHSMDTYINNIEKSGLATGISYQNIIHHLKKKEKDVNFQGASVKMSFLFTLKNVKLFLICFQNIYVPGVTTL